MYVSACLDNFLVTKCWHLFAFLSLALDLNPQYLKVRLRRAQCYEHEDRLEEALEGNGSEHDTPFLI